MHRSPWRVSLHGGHSGAYCDHATGTLAEVVQAAQEAGYHTFGLSEHVPRAEARFLYAKERELGWGVDHLHALFEAYDAEARRLVAACPAGFHLLRGFEAEVVPDDRWLELMQGLRARFQPDFVVGSVHHVAEHIIDGPAEDFEAALQACGGLEGLVVAYYRRLAEMIEAFRPEVVGHLDLIRKNGHRYGDVDTPAAREAAAAAIQAAARTGAILDLNVAGLRKGLPHPYPAPWLVQAAHAAGVGFCFGDDSHGPQDVGAGIDAGRRYLLGLGVEEVSVLTRDPGGAVVRRVASLREEAGA